MNEIARDHNESTELNLSTPKALLGKAGALMDKTAGLLSGKVALWILICLSAGFLGIHYAGMTEDPDIWWHLGYGEHFIDNLTLRIDHSQFGWTTSVSDWHYVNWLSSGIMYLIHSAFSFAGLKIFQYLVYLSLVLLYLRFLKNTGTRFSLIHLLGFLMIFIAATPIARIIKPEIFSTVGFNLVLLIYFQSKVTQRNYFKYLPLVFLVWANCHGGFLIGFILLGLLFAGEMLNLILRRDTALPGRLVWWLLACSIASVLAAGLNPSGYPLLINMVRKVVTPERTADVQHIIAMLDRWRHLFPEQYHFVQAHTAWLLVTMGASFVVLTLTALIRKRVCDLALVLTNVLFFLLAMKMARAVIFFPFLWIYSFAYLGWRTGFRVPVRVNPALVLLMLAMIGIGSWAVEVYFGTELYTSRSDDEILPVDSVTFIQQHEPPPPLFNDYGSGGYLVWELYPQYEVFIDPRYQPYYPEIWNDYMMLRREASVSNLNSLVAKYDFKTAIINFNTNANLVRAFNAANNWEMVFVDKVSAVFVKREPATTEYLDRMAELPQAPGFTDSQRFKEISNWRVLWGAFQCYLPVDINAARSIYFFFDENVADSMRYKQKCLDVMDTMLAQRYSDRRMNFPIVEVPNPVFF